MIKNIINKEYIKAEKLIEKKKKKDNKIKFFHQIKEGIF